MTKMKLESTAEDAIERIMEGENVAVVLEDIIFPGSIDEAEQMVFTHTDYNKNKSYLYVTDKSVRVTTSKGIPLSPSNFMVFGKEGYEAQTKKFEQAVRAAYKSGDENKVLAAVRKVTKDKNWVLGKK